MARSEKILFVRSADLGLALVTLAVLPWLAGCATPTSAYRERVNSLTSDHAPTGQADYLAQQADTRIEYPEATPPAPGDIFVRPKVIKVVAPRYPRDARREGRMGVVHVAVYLSAEGRVTDVKVARSTDSAFDEVALTAVRKWRFAPGTKNGVPVAAIITVPILFSF